MGRLGVGVHEQFASGRYRNRSPRMLACAPLEKSPAQGGLVSRECHVPKRRILLAPLTGRRFSRALGQCVLHHAGFLMMEAEQVAQLVFEDGEQVHAFLFALVAGRSEFLARRRIGEPAPDGGVA